jgi:predicted ATPase with chaperone activity
MGHLTPLLRTRDNFLATEAPMGELHLSARAHDRILKAARTIADLAGSEGIRLSISWKQSNTARWTEFVALSEKFHKEVA